ncbi:hypothetical protein MLD38_021928 [Melastoma candidum]|uniref:Uncharacterized protein n=1 Tax=Melastoma candidum TaxID=119954 RepID=A0ACB9QJF3_9MYRT|nr:hypothetical protein MLD38_021928 [Melastoma candidum]
MSMRLLLSLPPAASLWHSQWGRPRNISLSSPSTRTTCSAAPSLPGLADVDAFVGYISGRNKATDVAHSVWKRFVRKGDSVVDATCGNGYDTLSMLHLIADNSSRGRVYGMDVQEDALRSTSHLLRQSLSPKELELVRLFPLCHSRMEEVIPAFASVRLVAFNLGYLPGGDKSVTTKAGTTLLALEAAGRLVESGGLISVVVYVGHPGGSSQHLLMETLEIYQHTFPLLLKE